MQVQSEEHKPLHVEPTSRSGVYLLRGLCPLIGMPVCPKNLVTKPTIASMTGPALAIHDAIHISKMQEYMGVTISRDSQRHLIVYLRLIDMLAYATPGAMIPPINAGFFCRHWFSQALKNCHTPSHNTILTATPTACETPG